MSTHMGSRLCECLLCWWYFMQQLFRSFHQFYRRRYVWKLNVSILLILFIYLFIKSFERQQILRVFNQSFPSALSSAINKMLQLFSCGYVVTFLLNDIQFLKYICIYYSSVFYSPGERIPQDTGRIGVHREKLQAFLRHGYGERQHE